MSCGEDARLVHLGPEAPFEWRVSVTARERPTGEKVQVSYLDIRGLELMQMRENRVDMSFTCGSKLKGRTRA